MSVKEKSKKKAKKKKKSKKTQNQKKKQQQKKTDGGEKKKRKRKTMRLLEIPRVSRRIMGNPAQNHGTEIAHSAGSGTVGGHGNTDIVS